MRRDLWITLAAFVLVIGMYTAVVADTGTTIDDVSEEYTGLIQEAGWWAFGAGAVGIICMLVTHSMHGGLFIGAMLLSIAGGLVATWDDWAGLVGLAQGATLP